MRSATSCDGGAGAPVWRGRPEEMVFGNGPDGSGQSRHRGIHPEGLQLCISSPGKPIGSAHIEDFHDRLRECTRASRADARPMRAIPLLGRAVPPVRKPPAHRPAWTGRPAGERQVCVPLLRGVTAVPRRRGGRGVILADSRSASPASGPTDSRSAASSFGQTRRTSSPPGRGNRSRRVRSRRG